ncbi:TetR family transcriptional regulator, partial [Mycobacterium rhizamassiliense]
VPIHPIRRTRRRRSSAPRTADADPGYAKDLELILNGVIFGFLGRFTEGEIDVTGIVPGIERTVFWLTAAYEEKPVNR